MSTVTTRRRTVAALGVRLNRWDDCGGYDVCDRRTGDRLGTVAKRGGEFHAEGQGARLGHWTRQYTAVAAVVNAARH